jgi:prepilin-type N-terminal cleavage/methylation domain-containing protein
MTRKRRRPSPAGFTLMEVVVAATILVILAAVTIPQMLDALDRQRIEATVEVLDEIHYAITNTAGTGFMNVVRTGNSINTSSTTPGRLFHLSERIIVNNQTNYHNSCGSGATATWRYNATATQQWMASGPFLKRAVSSTSGMPVPIGQILSTITRNVLPPNVPSFIRLQIDGVDVTDAAALDVRVDGVADPNSGTITYTTVAGESLVLYWIPVPSNRC